MQNSHVSLFNHFVYDHLLFASSNIPLNVFVSVSKHTMSTSFIHSSTTTVHFEPFEMTPCRLFRAAIFSFRVSPFSFLLQCACALAIPLFLVIFSIYLDLEDNSRLIKSYHVMLKCTHCQNLSYLFLQ